MRLKSKLKAFTLLECLIALLVISGSVLVYQGLTRTLSSNIHYFSSNHQSNWLLFAKQLQSEWENCQLDHVKWNAAFFSPKNRTLRKRVKIAKFEERNST